MADLSQIPTDQLMQMLQSHPDVQAAPQADSGVGSFVRGLGNSATLGFLDPAVAAIQSAVGDPTNPTSHAGSYGQRYHENLAALRGVAQADQAQHPVASFGGDMAGGLLLPVGKIASVGAAARVGAKLGLGYGLGQGVTEDKGLTNIADRGLEGTLSGGIGGAVLGKAGDMLSNAVLPKIKAVTADALKQTSQAAYKRLEDNGVLVSTDAVNAMGDSLQDKFGDKLTPELQALYPKATAAFNMLSKYATDGKSGDTPVTFSKLDQIRRVVADAGQSNDKSDRAVARQLQDHLDDFVANLKPEDMDTTALDAARSQAASATGQMGVASKAIKSIEQNKSGALAARGAAGAGTRQRYMDLRQTLGDAGTARQSALQDVQAATHEINTAPQQAISDLSEARDNWKRYAKASQLQAIIDKAKNNSTGFAQSGYENALRSGFRKLLNNDRGISRFTPDEQAAIKQVATGGSALSATNLLRQVGKLSPQGAIPILSEIAMYGAAGPSALALPAAGIAGRVGATVLQKNAAKRAVNLAAMGPEGASALSAVQLPVPLPRLQAAKISRRLPMMLLPGALSAFPSTQ